MPDSLKKYHPPELINSGDKQLELANEILHQVRR
jgi:hypothetical protein